MAKKIISPKAISDREILAMYEDVLQLLYDNPNGLNPASQINAQLRAFIQYDFLHYVMEGEGGLKRLETKLELWDGFGGSKRELSISPISNDVPELGDNFKEHIQRNYERVIENRIALHPEPKEFHYYRLESKTYPRIVIGFFRAKEKGTKRAFTPAEKRFFKRIAPHLFRLYRTVLTHLEHSDTFRYFDSFSKIGSRIANECALSETETKLLPDILFGYSNEEIAERHFVSLATVKTHVNHIFKKTGSKNRMDFVAKFFTSPENVQL